MKLIRVGSAGQERPGVLIGEDTYVDVSDLTPDFGEDFFRSGGIALIKDAVEQRVASGELAALNGIRIGAPIARPHQILCIGLNYSDHAAETGQAIPDEPIVFNKAPNTLVGPNDAVRIPRGSTKPDWEVELGIVIGTPVELPARRGRGGQPRSPATCWSTTSASALTRSSVAASG